MASALRAAFVGIPSVLAQHVLWSVHRNATLVGIVESRLASWRASGAVSAHKSSFVTAARRLNIPHLLLDHGEPLVLWMQRLRLDVLCVGGMARLLKPAEFTVPRCGSINFHPSLLPNYRGPDPFYWQYHQCDLAGGVSIHQISAAADQGDILVQKPYAIALGDDFVTTQKRAARLGAVAMGETLQTLATGSLRPRSQSQLPCPLYARMVPPGDPPKEWMRWPLDRTWHFLRGWRLRHW